MRGTLTPYSLPAFAGAFDLALYDPFASVRQCQGIKPLRDFTSSFEIEHPILDIARIPMHLKRK